MRSTSRDGGPRFVGLAALRTALLVILITPQTQPARAAEAAEALQQRVEHLQRTVERLERQVGKLQRTVEQLQQRMQEPESQGVASRSAPEARQPMEAASPSAAVLTPMPPPNQQTLQVQRPTPAPRAASEVRRPLQTGPPSTGGLAAAPTATGQKPEMHPVVAPTAASEARQPVQTVSPSTEGLTLTPQTKEHWRTLREGMPDLEVRALLGEPSRTFELSGNTVWYYYYTGTGGGSVMLSKGGKVTSWQRPPFGWLW
jgi:TolA-binding protein